MQSSSNNFRGKRRAYFKGQIVRWLTQNCLERPKRNLRRIKLRSQTLRFLFHWTEHAIEWISDAGFSMCISKRERLCGGVQICVSLWWWHSGCLVRHFQGSKYQTMHKLFDPKCRHTHTQRHTESHTHPTAVTHASLLFPQWMHSWS